MPLISPGTPVSERLIFNTGYIDFGIEQLVDVQNAVVELTFTEKELRRLNSIKMAAHKRATFKCSFRAKVKSINQEVLAALMGKSEVDGSGHIITVPDGQAPILNPVFTGYVDDNPLNPIQFQFTDAICTRLPTTANLEEFGEQDIELAARDVSVFYYE